MVLLLAHFVDSTYRNPLIFCINYLYVGTDKPGFYQLLFSPTFEWICAFGFNHCENPCVSFIPRDFSSNSLKKLII